VTHRTGSHALKSESQVVAGKAGKYYTITRRGRSALDKLRPKLKELVDEVLS
jgi:DNA-binding PadR family transcriptional regulator